MLSPKSPNVIALSAVPLRDQVITLFKKVFCIKRSNKFLNPAITHLLIHWHFGNYHVPSALHNRNHKN